MSDNSDLLAGASDTPAVPVPATEAPKRRGRPPGSGKKKAADVVPASTTQTAVDLGRLGGDKTAEATFGHLVNGDIKVVDVRVAEPDGLTDEQVEALARQGDDVPKFTTPPLTAISGADTLTDANDPPPSELVSVPNADGSVSVQLPPVSTEYAAAMAQRIHIIGQPRRDYAYKRLLRAGKKL